jgi:hypothetical protein
LNFKKKVGVITTTAATSSETSARHHHNTMPVSTRGIYEAAKRYFPDNEDLFLGVLVGRGYYIGGWRSSVPSFPQGAAGWISKTSNSSCLAIWSGLDNKDNVHWLRTERRQVGESEWKDVTVYYMAPLDEFLKMLE